MSQEAPGEIVEPKGPFDQPCGLWGAGAGDKIWPTHGGSSAASRVRSRGTRTPAGWTASSCSTASKSPARGSMCRSLGPCWAPAARMSRLAAMENGARGRWHHRRTEHNLAPQVLLLRLRGRSPGNSREASRGGCRIGVCGVTSGRLHFGPSGDSNFCLPQHGLVSTREGPTLPAVGRLPGVAGAVRAAGRLPGRAGKGGGGSPAVGHGGHGERGVSPSRYGVYFVADPELDGEETDDVNDAGAGQPSENGNGRDGQDGQDGRAGHGLSGP